jgi:hypothetical protein
MFGRLPGGVDPGAAIMRLRGRLLRDRLLRWSAATTGRSAALVGSGLLVDRHRALLAAAAILVGLVVVVAAVRIPA